MIFEIFFLLYIINMIDEDGNAARQQVNVILMVMMHNSSTAPAGAEVLFLS